MRAYVTVEERSYAVRDAGGAEVYRMAREYGMTDNGNELNGRWVLRDAAGTIVDFDRYRSDLAERNGFDIGLPEE